jgi:hypothetical protein
MPASLDSLANGTKVTLRWGHFRIGTPIEDETAKEIKVNAQRDCEAAEPTNDPQATELKCSNSAYAIHGYARARHREYVWHTVRGGATDFGLDATVGINDFEWLDPVTFFPHKDRQTDWSVTANIAQYFAGTAITGSVSYQRAYKAADETQVCPLGSTDPADCIKGRTAAPSRDSHLLLSAGLRHRFLGSDGNRMRLAVAPQVNYDVEEDVFGVDVPVYFIPGADDSLTGGVRFGYRSDRDDKFSVAVFLGTTFSFFQ